jgi:hypothetical protein
MSPLWACEAAADEAGSDTTQRDTNSDWGCQGRNNLTMADHRDGERHEIFIIIEGFPVQELALNAIIAMVLFRQVQRFPTYLLDVSNTMIWRILERAFEPVCNVHG